MIRFLAILALCACVTPSRPWRVEGAAWDVQAYADAAVRVTHDRKGWLRAGGVVSVRRALDGVCFADPGWHPSGCAAPGHVYVLVMPERGLGPGPETTALAHEFCHLGLATGGGYSGPVVEATEGQADACALLVTKEASP